MKHDSSWALRRVLKSLGRFFHRAQRKYILPNLPAGAEEKSAAALVPRKRSANAPLN